MDRDDELMMAYAEGDPFAFAELYDRHADAVYGFCLRRLGEEAAAADVLQETFRRLVDARDRFEPRGRFRSYLFTLARSACVDDVRSRRADERLEELRQEGFQPESADPAPGSRLETEEQLRRLLALLTEEQREVLILAKYHGFPHAEIAEMTGATEAAVKQKVYRALRRLRQAVGEERS
ncbi:MAG: sigma-70 family RNA polymerase sigma factor [Gemmatimonadetes bacterium]|nr:sigma-70 family RNA polymerase sigma factor [Gemmatimonadota bacterium]NIR78200.1 sigma-70 family RNA polymerase sigma factor [Gemmatimonadota bacterium]NIT89383.1 sigma-70 family RNA polymerase sigma factor [Gemmatimonadota bacterium]NIU30350.1 sigma-70 family RNA polymerase sigma factor [Gemmatimonadota bacterium]NIU35235.1 sigma-70 family RNA polymerase sigma factor [Gemmatimonadota bacterium]